MKTKNSAPKKESFFGSSGEFLLKRTKYPIFEKVTFWFVLVILALFPLFVGPEGYSNITVTKFIGFAVITVIYAAIIALVGMEVYLLDKKAGKARLAEIPSAFGIPQYMAVGIFLLALLSMLISKQPEMWIGQSRYEGLFSVLLYTVVFLGVSCFGEFSDRYIYAFAACMTVFCFIAFIQISGSPFLMLRSFFDGRFLAMTGNVDVVSGFIATAVPLLFAAFVFLEGKARYFFFLPQIAALVFIQLFIGVDSGKIGLIAAAAFLVILCPTSWKSIGRFFAAASAVSVGFAAYKLFSITGNAESVTVSLSAGKAFYIFTAAAVLFAAAAVFISKIKKPFPFTAKKARLIMLILVLLFAAAVCMYLYNYSGENTLLFEISEVLHGRLSDKAGSNRGFIWRYTALAIGENPLLGTGPGTYLMAFNEYSELFRETYNIQTQFDFAHNDFLQIGLERGLLSLGLYLAMLVVIAVRAIKAMDRNPLVIIFGAAVVGYLFHIFFAFSVAILAPIYWVCLGLLVKCTAQTPPAETEK